MDTWEISKAVVNNFQTKMFKKQGLITPVFFRKFDERHKISDKDL